MENKRNRKIVLDNKKLIRSDIQLSTLIPGSFKEYKIKIDVLWLNPYSDRFAKERFQDEDLDENNSEEILFSENVQEKISDLIWETNVKKNNITLKDIKEIGIKESIVIDQSGLVIDGNRRVSIARRILKDESLIFEQRNKLKEINCIVINDILNKKKISNYEAALQIAKDKKLDYDPINLYLKIDKLLNADDRKNLDDEVKYKEVSELMGITQYNKEKIKTFKETFDIMKDYLISIDKKGNFIELERREDQFKHFSKFWNKLEQNKYENSKLDFEDINNRNDIKKICYALINQQVEGKCFREVFPKPKNPSGPLTSKISIEYLKNQLEINNSNNKDLKILANHSSSKFPSEFLTQIIEKSKVISSNTNNEVDANIKVFIEDIRKKVKNLKKQFQGKKDCNNEPFLKDIEKIKNNLNEIMNDIKKDRY